jgi:hypothetical protein
MEKAVASWLALAKHIIPEDDIRAQFIGWLVEASDLKQPPPRIPLALRGYQGIGKSLLFRPFISAGLAVEREASELYPESMYGIPEESSDKLAVVEDYPVYSPEKWGSLRGILRRHLGRVAVLSNAIGMPISDPLGTGAGPFWAYDSRATPLPQEYYRRHIKVVGTPSASVVVAGIVASLNQ